METTQNKGNTTVTRSCEVTVEMTPRTAKPTYGVSILYLVVPFSVISNIPNKHATTGFLVPSFSFGILPLPP